MDRAESSQNKNDNETLFFDIIQKYQDQIFRFVYFRVNSRATALDITQDVFTKTWIYLSSGKTIDYPEAFVYRTAKNAVIDFYKKSKSASLDMMTELGFDPETTATHDDILRNDDIAMVRQLMEDLDEESRQIIFMRFTEEKPIEEIASLFGKNANAMTVRIHRIIKKLRDIHDKRHNS